MLQRVQTIYMLAGVIAILMLFIFPLATFSNSIATFELSAFGLTSVTETVPFDAMRWTLMCVLLIMFALPLVAIFMYKNHKRQLRLLIFTAVLDALFYALYYLWEIPACEDLFAVATAVRECESASTFLPAIMPAISIFCCIMAIKGVVYDMALLSSADRLRTSRKK